MTLTQITNTSDALSAISSERAFLGAVINGDARLLDSGLTLEDFTGPFCRAVYAAVARLEEAGKQPDLVTLTDASPELDFGEVVAITQEALPSLAERCAANIREASQRRALSALCGELAGQAKDGLQPIDDVLSAARARLDALISRSPQTGVVTGTDAKIELYRYLTEAPASPPVPTGLPALDGKLCGGLRGGKLVVVGARPAVGKSALLASFAVSAILAGRRVLFVSLEMSAREIVARMASNLSGVSAEKLEARDVSPEDAARVLEAFNLISPDENLRFAERAGTPSAVRRAALRMRADAGLDLIVVDYLQLLRADGKPGSRWEAVGEISRSLKLLAAELDVPVVAAAQLNRASEGRGEQPERPRLSDLRESGSIEQDADVVLLLHASDPDNAALRELIVAKNRQGRTGVTQLYFDGDRMRFLPVEMARKEG